MPSGYKVGGASGTDLDAIFKARITTKRADVGFDVSNGSGVQGDISNRYEKALTSAHWIPANTGFISGPASDTDLRELFMDIDFVLGPIITDQPDNITVVEGGNLTFTLTAEASPGGGTLSYQWQRDVGAGWTNVGTNSNTLSINPCDRDDQGSYRCQVTDSNGTTQSNTVTGTVNYPPVITSNPTGGTFNIGNAVGLSIEFTEGRPSGATIQWYRDGVPLNDFMEDEKYSGSNTTDLSFLAEASDHGDGYYCTVSNSAGSDTSTTATILVNQAPVVTTHPTGATVYSGQGVSFTIVATGYPAPTYQWYKDGSPLSGETSDTLNISSPTPSDDGDYHCRATNSSGFDDSNTATLIVHPAPVITSHPSNITDTEGTGPHALQCSATGTSLQFSWYRNGNLVAGPRDGNLGAGQDQHVFNPLVYPDDGGTWYCSVEDGGGNVANSNNATVTVEVDPPVITTGPGGPYTLNVGDVFNVSVTASGNHLTYQWKKNGTNIGGATTDTLTFQTTGESDEGTYECVVTNPGGSDSDSCTLTMNP